jgi:hypothetical protein
MLEQSRSVTAARRCRNRAQPPVARLAAMRPDFATACRRGAAIAARDAKV